MSATNASDENAILPVTIGTVIWVLVLAALLARKSALDEAGQGWWIAVAAVGVVSGAGGLLFLHWRRRRRSGVA